MPPRNTAADKSMADATEKKDEEKKMSGVKQNETNESKPSKEKEQTKAKSKSKKNKANKKNKKAKRNVPKPGEPGYLSPTQLRNARKRRAKQNKKRELEESEAGQHTGSANDESGGSSNKKAKRSQAAKKGGGNNNGGDPSLKFLRNPQGAPVVQAARKYFATKLPTTADNKFKVHMGPTTGWRTVAKLATRPDPASDSNATKKKKMIIGLFEPKSHAIVPVPNCSAHHPSINAAVACLTDMCNRIGIAAFDERTGEGYLRYLAMSVERKTGKVQLTLVWNSSPYSVDDDDDNANEDATTAIEGKKMLDRLIGEIRRTTQFDGAHAEHSAPAKKKRRRGKKGREDTNGNGETAKSDVTVDISQNNGASSPPFELHSLFVHYNNQWKHSNAIFDISSPAESSWRHVCGPAYVEEVLDLGTGTKGDVDAASPAQPIALRFPPNVFRQANLDAFAGIVSAIRRRVSRYVEKSNKSADGDSNKKLPSCLELYGGVGTIGLNLVDLTSSLTSSDENPNNVACFRGSVEDSSWPDEMKARARYIGKNATKMIEDGVNYLSKSDILVVDPPRKGLEEPVLAALVDKWTKQLPRLVVYVSCGFDAFQRDCNAMLESGRWTLEHAEGHLLFPGSDAIETLAFFVRKE